MRTKLVIVMVFIALLTIPAQSFQEQNSVPHNEQNAPLIRQTDTSVVKKGIVNATNVNIRKGPSITKQIVGKIPNKGAFVDVIGCKGVWYKVRVDSIEGWIYEDYISLREDKPEYMPDILSVDDESSIMNGKPSITDSKDNLIVKSITFRIDNNRTEKVFIDLSHFYIPHIIALEGKKPRVAIDIPNVSSWDERNKIMPVKGRLVKSIRTHLHRNSETLRIVLDLDPVKNYTANPIYYKAENIYCIEITDSY